ncbi:hypothetical protein AB1Y20_012129 [Prymnesium parvum]|uniref:EGF-like domain-containing protein n=1 Tax=Prymnesium parvum TaxID=97485 RepID=A0AB34IMK8_PRYPA
MMRRLHGAGVAGAPAPAPVAAVRHSPFGWLTLTIGLIGALHFLSDLTGRTSPSFSTAQPKLLSASASAHHPLPVGASGAAATPSLPSAGGQGPPPASRPPPPPPHRPCAKGCEANGNCNRELGRCDCPPLMAGEACDEGLAPTCRVQWGLELPTPPCQAWSPEGEDWRDFPPTCECLAECHALNQRVAYMAACVNVSQRALAPARDAGARYPFADPYSDGRWAREAYAPRPKEWPRRAEASVRRLNLALAARLERDARRSAAEGRCSGRGIWTLVMPWKHPPPYVEGGGLAEGECAEESCQHNPRGVRGCHCLPGWSGAACEVAPGGGAAPEPKRYCVHRCSGRGVCKLNWCHCVPGTWGVDCSLGTPLAPPHAVAGVPRWGGAAWDAAMWARAAVALPPPSASLRIFVYDLPPRFNIWLAAHFRVPGRWDQSYLYSLDAKIHRWLLRSPYRTLEPAEADFFFVPTYLSQGFYDFEFGLYWLAPRGLAFLREAMAYVRTTWPYFDRSGGADHLLVMTNDKGATFIRGAVPDLRRMILLTQWGWKRPHIHLPGQDIVMPPMLKIDKLVASSPYRTGVKLEDSPRYQYLLSFIGSVRFHTPGYSMGVRQKIFRAYNATDRFFLRDLRGDSRKGPHKRMDPKEYLEVLQASKFCLAPSGMGFSTRTYESMAQGCVPLIIQDDPLSNSTVDQAFEELLPWHEFSYRLKQEDIPRLPQILESVPDSKMRELRRNLACVWPRVLWLQADNEAPGEQLAEEQAAARAEHLSMLGDDAFLVAYDAWESVMHTLKRRVAKRKGWPLAPFEWRTPASSCKLT